MLDGMSVEEFEQAVDSDLRGVLLDWNKLLRFASGVEQTHDLLLVSVEDGEDLSVAEVDDEDLSRCPFVIQALDSAKWVIVTRSNSVDLEGYQELKKRVLV